MYGKTADRIHLFQKHSPYSTEITNRSLIFTARNPSSNLFASCATAFPVRILRPVNSVFKPRSLLLSSSCSNKLFYLDLLVGFIQRLEAFPEFIVFHRHSLT